MKLKIDWKSLFKAVFKALTPFVLGAIGGLTSGCISEDDILVHFFA